MLMTVDIYGTGLDAKHIDKDHAAKCWICNMMAYKSEADGSQECPCGKSYAVLLKEWPAYKQTLIDAFNKQEAESKKNKLYDATAVSKAIEAEDANEDPNDYIQIIDKFLGKLDVKHNHKFKTKLTKAMKESKLIAWLTAMDKHIGNAEDYLN